ncbi:MAG TPA: hypothetical protein VFM69_02070, partial [Pricia sp.]|nr:hypothetical protein [Pricia sp.]
GKPFWFVTLNDPPINLPTDNQQKGNQNQESQNQENQNQENTNQEIPGQENQKQNRLQHSNLGKVVFSFPGNPVSTFANYHIYFLPWLATSLGIGVEDRSVILDAPVRPHPNMTLFLQVKTQWRHGRLHAKLVQGNGSGDLVSLAKADGIIRVPNGESGISEGEVVPVIPFN